MANACAFVGGLTRSLERRPRHYVPALQRRRASNSRCSVTVSANAGSGGSDHSPIPQLSEALQLLRSRGCDVQRRAPGEVFLVGTGPGDPSLLTLRAVQLMQTADVVLYDRLVSDDILQYVSPNARMVYVGKHKGFHTRSQEDIQELLFQFCSAGGTILRLKGGDPYVFGRGGEELDYLERRGTHVRCVPGITAASGISAELGIPLTHRGIASSVRYITGHVRDDGEQLTESFRSAADANTTLVIYMGLSNLRTLVDDLVQVGGLRPDMPAVAVERGTMPEQRAVFGTISQLNDKVQRAQLQSPTLVIIGDVVALAREWPSRQSADVVLGDKLHAWPSPSMSDSSSLKSTIAVSSGSALQA